MITCPCCGSKFAGDTFESCASCGALSVGPPLARPARELPAYGRAFAVAGAGLLLTISFLSATIFALVEREPFSLDFWNVVAAAQTAAWRLKWVVLPLSLLAVWGSARVRASLRREPRLFTGARLVRAGLAASATVAFLIATLIGVTIPDRLRQRELARQAEQDSLRYAVERVLLQYKIRHKTLPSEADDLVSLLPEDADGSVNKVRLLLKSGTYTPEASLASLPAQAASKGRGGRARAARMTPVSLKSSADDAPGEGVSFTGYELILPGRDGINGTEDDLRIRDGSFVENTQATARRVAGSPAQSQIRPAP